MNKEISRIEYQLNRKINGLYQIESYCYYGFPRVISTIPKLNDVLFPTLYWLTCPYLKKQLDSLEESGMIRELSYKISKSKELLTLYIKETEEYIKRRSRLFQMHFPNEEIPERISKSGIGGIKNWKKLSGIKCLHLHFAYFLVYPEEIIGNMINDKISFICPHNECRGFTDS